MRQQPRSRQNIFDRINQRVDEMVEAGLFEEAKSLQEYRDHNALQTVGYKEIYQYLDDKISKTKAIEEIKKNSRRYAKRQLTWFRRDNEMVWFNPNDVEKIKQYISNQSWKAGDTYYILFPYSTMALLP